MPEKVVNIFCAQPLGNEQVEKVTIHIHVPVQDFGDRFDWEQALRDMYMEQGNTLAEALCGSLPGGTIDALLVDMLDRKRSLLIVPLFTEQKGAKDNGRKH